jgi:hypothetical protein
MHDNYTIDRKGGQQLQVHNICHQIIWCISLEMPVPSQGHYGLYNYEFWLSLCKIVRSSVILLLPLLNNLTLTCIQLHAISQCKQSYRTLTFVIPIDPIWPPYVDVACPAPKKPDIILRHPSTIIPLLIAWIDGGGTRAILAHAW